MACVHCSWSGRAYARAPTLRKYSNLCLRSRRDAVQSRSIDQIAPRVCHQRPRLHIDLHTSMPNRGFFCFCRSFPQLYYYFQIIRFRKAFPPPSRFQRTTRLTLPPPSRVCVFLSTWCTILLLLYYYYDQQGRVIITFIFLG